ncbi:MAG: dTDP-4-dehydrorhamnose 3,5-epimerase [Roseiarcus sp.]|jgi:dTDP-4-dehydrorhamnose 3,5-epimerase
MSAIIVEATAIPEVKVVSVKKLRDTRGFFSETYSRRAFAEAGLPYEFVQENHSLSLAAGTIRGLHFQSPPFAQDKLVRVTAGRICDVAVDLRRSSPSFGRHVRIELSAENWRQALIPIGFAHGFCTLEPGTEVVYKVTNYYSAADDHGLAWDDPDLAIDWPAPRAAVALSERDRRHPRLRDLPAWFD